VVNNTPVFFLGDPLKFSDLNHAVKRDLYESIKKGDFRAGLSIPPSAQRLLCLSSSEQDVS